MASSVLGTLQVIIEGNNKDLLKKLRASENAMKNTYGVLSKAGSSLQTVGSAMTTGITVPIAAATTALGLLAAKAVSLEKQMKEVFTLLPGITKSGMDEMTDSVIDFSKRMGMLPEDVVKPLYDALSAGVPQDNVFEFMEVAAQNSVGGVASLAESVDLLTSVVNAYGLETEKTTEVSDLLFTTVRLGKTTISELGASISDVTPIAAAAKVSFADISAAIATMTAQGIGTAESTTFLKNIISELGKETSGVAVLFKDITGSSFPQFIEQGGNMSEALAILEEHANSNDTAINNLFGSIRSGQAALALTGANAETFAQNLAEMENAAGATGAAFETMEESVSRRLDKLKAAFYGALIETGNNLLPVLEDLIPIVQNQLLPVFEKLAGKVGNAIQKFADMEPGMQKAVLVMTALAAGVGPATSGIGKLVSGIGNFSKAMSALKPLAAALLSPTGLIVAGIAAAGVGVALLVKHAKEKKISQEMEAMADHIDRANLNAENFEEQVRAIARETGLTVGQVIDIADQHGIITDEIREQAEALKDMGGEASQTTKEIADQNYQIKAMLGPAVNSLADMDEVVKNFAQSSGLSIERIATQALQLDSLTDRQREQIETLVEEEKAFRESLKYSDAFLRNEAERSHAAQAAREEQERITAEKEEQLIKEQELLAIEQARANAEKKYSEGLEEMQSIIDGNVSELDRLQAKYDELASYRWTDEQTYQLGIQEEALGILSEKIEALKQQQIDAEKEKAQAIQDANQEWIDKAREQGADEIQLLEWEKAEAIRLAEEEGLATFAIRLYYDELLDQKREELAEREKQRYLDTASTYINAFSSALSTLNSLFQQSADNKSAAIDDWYKREKKAIESSITNGEKRTEALDKLEEEYDKKKRKRQREEAKRNKSMAIFNAVIGGANAVINALQTQPFWLGIIMAALATAMTGVQIGLIANEPLPALADGGKIMPTVGVLIFRLI